MVSWKICVLMLFASCVLSLPVVEEHENWYSHRPREKDETDYSNIDVSDFNNEDDVSTNDEQARSSNEQVDVQVLPDDFENPSNKSPEDINEDIDQNDNTREARNLDDEDINVNNDNNDNNKDETSKIDNFDIGL